MGFSIYYRSTRPVTKAEAAALQTAAAQASENRTWLSCEPAHFYPQAPEDEGRLAGGSKLNFTPHPDDAASALLLGLPDGNVLDLLQVLCRLSQEHRIDWEFHHDHMSESVGSIRDGVCDPELTEAAAVLADVAGALSDFEFEFEEPSDDDDEPRILPFKSL